MTETSQYGNQTQLAHQSKSDKSVELTRMLIEENEGYDDFIWKPRSDNTVDKARIQVGLPKSHIRITNQGIADSKGRRVETYWSGMKLESRFRNDEDYLDDLPNPDMERYEEIEDHMSVLGMDFWQNLFWGSGLNGEILGVLNMFDDLNLKNAPNAKNIVDATKTYASDITDNPAPTTMGDAANDYLNLVVIKHHPTKFYCHYPPRFGANPKHFDRGLQEVTENGKTFDAQTDKLRWKFGYTPKKWSAVSVVRNVRLKDLRFNPFKQGGPNLVIAVIAALKRIVKGAGKVCIYADPNVLEYLDYHKMSVGWGAGQTIQGAEGADFDTFRKTPLRSVDALSALDVGVKKQATA